MVAPDADGPIVKSGGGGVLTVCTSGADVLTLKFVLPEYFAVIECRPVVRAEVETVA